MNSILPFLCVLLLAMLLLAWIAKQYRLAEIDAMKVEPIYCSKVDGVWDLIDGKPCTYIKRVVTHDHGWHGKFIITEYRRVELLPDDTYKLISDWFRPGDPESKIEWTFHCAR